MGQANRVPARLRDPLICALLLAFSVLLVLPNFWGELKWSPDGLFYQAQVRELRGEGRYEALRNVFESDYARPLAEREDDLPKAERRIENEDWVDYSSDFYRRRWTVPAAAAAITPIFGLRSLELVSLIGLVLMAPLLYLLLRRRFSPLASGATAVFAAVLPPVLNLAPEPRTDSWGLTLLILALLVGLYAVERGRWWMVAWVAVMLFLSFTRDADVVALAAVGWLALRTRSQRAVLATGLGLLAAAPALLIFSAPLHHNLAYVLNDYRVPTDTSWSSIASAYPGQLVDVLHSDVRFPFETSAWAVLLSFVAALGLLTLLFGPNRNGTLLTMARGTLFGAVLTVLVSINYTELRIELVFLPAVAFGVALLIETILARVSERRATPATAPG